MTHLLLIEVASADEVRAAVGAAAEAGFAPCDLLTPHPVEGLEGHLIPPPGRKPIGWVMAGAGALGAIVGYIMQWFSATIDYPTLSGGRPLHSWPAFLLVPYETTILAAAITGILTWMAMCGLPKLHHLVFAADATERASQDRYFVVIPFSAALAAWAGKRFRQDRIHEVRG